MKTILSIMLTTGLVSSMAQAQTCTRSVNASTPAVQFTVSGSEVTDLRTNLIWSRCAVGQAWSGSTCIGAATGLTWSQALSIGVGSWRLPNIKELLSIVEVSCDSPSINATIFPNTASTFFWTASPYINNNQAWSVSFEDGNDEGGSKAGGLAVRLVRNP